jgi:SAM-dependent methyltransferase
MKYVNCNFCGQDVTELVNKGSDLLLNRWDVMFQLGRCCNCGLIYQNPQLTFDELSQYYPDTYLCFLPKIKNEKSLFSRLDQFLGMGRRCRQITHLSPKPGKLLDLGCATGLFMKGMEERGWQVTGVEINDYAADYARCTFGLDVKTGTLEQVAFDDMMFDVVTLWGVFEHVMDPKATLAEIGRILKPGGLVAMALPNPTAVEAWLFGENWVGWDRPRHLHIFTPKVIRNYLVDAGLKLTKIESFSGRWGITLLNIEFWLKANKIPERKWRPLLQVLYNWPLRVLSWPVYRMAEGFNKTTNMAIFATRER